MSNRSERFAFGAIVLLYLALAFLLFDQVEEDAFIYFRVVENLAHGYGLVFNAGGARIEVASSSLWTLLLFLLWPVPLNIVVKAKLLGLGLGCVTLWLVYALSRLSIRDPVLRLGPPLLAAASTPFLMWSQRGLDTPLFVVLVIWLALCGADPRRFRWWPVPAVLLLPARPEGFFFLLAILPAFAFERSHWRQVGGSIVVVAIAAIALLGARFWYFHDFVPQAFYVKLVPGGTTGLRQLYHFLVGSRLYVIGLPLLAAAVRRNFWTRQHLVICGFILITAVWCAIAKDYDPYFRHFVPGILLLYVLLVGAIDALRAEGHRGVARAFLVVAFGVTLLFSDSDKYFYKTGANPVRVHLDAFVTGPGDYLEELARKIENPSARNPLDRLCPTHDQWGSNLAARIGEFLRRNYPPGSLVVYDQMGQTPFYAGPAIHFIDSLGLTDRTIGQAFFDRLEQGSALLRVYDAVVSRAVAVAFGETRGDTTESEALDYLFSRHPDLIMINRVLVLGLPSSTTARLEHDPRLRRDYKFRYLLGRVVQLYERRGAARTTTLDVPAGLEVLRQ